MKIPHARGGPIGSWIWEAGLLLVLPLAFNRDFAEQFSTPKFFLTKCLLIAGLTMWALGKVWRTPRHRSRRSLGWPLLAFSIAVLISCVASPVPRFSLMEAEYALCGPAWVLLLTSWNRRETAVRRILLWVGIAGGLVAGITLLQRLSFDPILLGGYQGDWGSLVPRMRLYSTFGNPNYVGGYLIGTLFAALALAAAAGRLWAKAFWSAIALATLAAIWVTGSHGAWLGLAVGLAAAAALAMQNRKGRLAGIGLPGNFGGPRKASTTLEPSTQSFRTVSDKGGNLLSLSPLACFGVMILILILVERDIAQLAGRIYLWRFSWPIFWRHPLVGSGWGVYQLLFLDFQGKFLAARPEFTGYWTNNRLLHNDPLQLLLETGLLGLAASIWVLGKYGRQAWMIQRRALEPGTRYAISASVGGVTAILTDSLFNYQFAVPPTYILLFTLCALPGLVCEAPFEEETRALPAETSPRGPTSWQRPLQVSLSLSVLAFAAGLLWQQVRVLASERSYQTALELESQHDLAGAEAAYRRSVGLNGLNGRAHFGLSRALLSRGLSVEALQEVQRAEQTYADSHEEVLRARVLKRMGNDHEALTAYRHALWLDPTLTDIRQNIDRLSKAP